jgi:hypothetical protein
MNVRSVLTTNFVDPGDVFQKILSRSGQCLLYRSGSLWELERTMKKEGSPHTFCSSEINCMSVNNKKQR